MEFAVASFSVLSGFVISKLGVLMETKLKKNREIRVNVRIFKEDLEAIKSAIELRGPRRQHRVWIAQLRRLAYDIEDCIDRFDANLTNLNDFAQKIVELREILSAMTQRMQNFILPEEEADVVPIPVELQNLGDYNLNCLLYLRLFPPNHQVRTKPLIRRWLAEGLVLREQLAVHNLEVLTNSSIFNFIQRSNNGQVKKCQPTVETLRYISQRSLSENFILFCDGAAQLLEAPAARRLSVHPPANGELNLPQDLSRLRTLAVFHAGATNIDGYEALLQFTRYEVLRVLDLKECADLREEHLADICNQVLMKYLSINLGRIGSITREIGHLHQLETLDLSGSEIVTVFKEVLLLPKLRHLFGKFQLCTRDSTIFEFALRKFLREKSTLETLSGFVIGVSKGFPQLMSHMMRLQKVKIWCESNPSKENLYDISSAIVKFIREGTGQPDLNRSLSIDFEGCSKNFVNTIDTDVDGILASLKLRGNLSQFPQFVAQLSEIRELCLCSTNLRWKNIREGLRGVKGLKYLKLKEDNLVLLDILSGAEHLKAIERIYVVCNQRLEVTITATRLVSVHILCQDLHVVPGTPGIEITYMKELEEIGLHADVHNTIRSELQQAADGHPKKPNILVIQNP